MEEVVLESNIDHIQRNKTIKIFFQRRGRNQILEADLGGFSEKDEAITPHFFYQGNRYEEKHDLLELMIEKEVIAFARAGKDWDRDIVSFKKYLPIAEAQARLGDLFHNPVAVIGGGIFGLLAGIAIAKRGYPVTLFEKKNEIFLGASLVNQCRIHMGYHYPRDEGTARATLAAEEKFRKTFPDAVVRKGFENYYCFAREGSLVTKEQCLAFCKKLGLPYVEAFPRKVRVAKDKIEYSLKVPELIFDARKVKRGLSDMVDEIKNIEIKTAADVRRIARGELGYRIAYAHQGERKSERFSAIVNATYANVNHIHRMLGVSLPEYQYELCEMSVVKVPWKGKTGIAVMDGPFCGIMPFGFLKEHLLYDVELSILERSVGTLPRFKFDISYYDTPERRRERFVRLVEKMKQWIPQLDRVEPLYSIYATRIVLPRREGDDARPTVIHNPLPGLWSVFSGKITTSIPSGEKIGEMVDAYVKKGQFHES